MSEEARGAVCKTAETPKTSKTSGPRADLRLASCARIAHILRDPGQNPSRVQTRAGLGRAGCVSSGRHQELPAGSFFVAEGESSLPLWPPNSGSIRDALENGVRLYSLALAIRPFIFKGLQSWPETDLNHRNADLQFAPPSGRWPVRWRQAPSRAPSCPLPR